MRTSDESPSQEPRLNIFKPITFFFIRQSTPSYFPVRAVKAKTVSDHSFIRDIDIDIDILFPV